MADPVGAASMVSQETPHSKPPLQFASTGAHTGKPQQGSQYSFLPMWGNPSPVLRNPFASCWYCDKKLDCQFLLTGLLTILIT